MSCPAEQETHDLKEKIIHGGAARAVALAGGSSLRLVSVMILARLLEPGDFGLIGMVTAFTGVLNLFRDFGLSTFTVQRATITREQSPTLFWINAMVGTLLAGATAAAAPLVAAFYREPRLFWITAVVAAGFVFNGLGVQQSALLQRRMRFTTLAVIDGGSLVFSTALAIGAAKAGLGYWALVIMTLALPFSTTIAVWLASAWLPGMPRRGVGLALMMRFGGTLTLNGLVMYVAVIDAMGEIQSATSDLTVERLLESVLLQCMKSRGIDTVPFIWFWPDDASSAAILTHDVETAEGLDYCPRLMDIDESFGFRSSFQVVPQERYPVTEAFLTEIRERGHEINVQDLNHDGNLFRDRHQFLSRVKAINDYGRLWGARGFRSAILYRNLNWYDSLEFQYDMSVPNVGHLYPQRGGCCTVFPISSSGSSNSRSPRHRITLYSTSDPKPENETVHKLRLLFGCGPLDESRRRTNAEEGTHRGVNPKIETGS